MTYQELEIVLLALRYGESNIENEYAETGSFSAKTQLDQMVTAITIIEYEKRKTPLHEV